MKNLTNFLSDLTQNSILDFLTVNNGLNFEATGAKMILIDFFFRE